MQRDYPHPCGRSLTSTLAASDVIHMATSIYHISRHQSAFQNGLLQKAQTSINGIYVASVMSTFSDADST